MFSAEYCVTVGQSLREPSALIQISTQIGDLSPRGGLQTKENTASLKADVLHVQKDKHKLLLQRSLLWVRGTGRLNIKVATFASQTTRAERDSRKNAEPATSELQLLTSVTLISSLEKISMNWDIWLIISPVSIVTLAQQLWNLQKKSAMLALALWHKL